jgi:uncharacterized protein YxjI
LNGRIVDVTIEERSISFATEYDISTPDRELYARKEMFTLLNKIELQTKGGGTIARLQGQFSVLRSKYEFDLMGGGIYHFECVDLWKSIYECRFGDDLLTLYQHKGLNHSIFKNERQIAAYSKNRVTFGKSNKYEIRMDADANLTLVLCMVLALSVSDDNDDKEAVNIDFGSIGPEGKALDTAWKPR